MSHQKAQEGIPSTLGIDIEMKNEGMKKVEVGIQVRGKKPSYLLRFPASGIIISSLISMDLPWIQARNLDLRRGQKKRKRSQV